MNQRYHQGSRAFRTPLAAALAASFALLCAAPATATTISFSSLTPDAHVSGETLAENGYDMLLVEGPVGAYYGAVSGTGTIADAANTATCDLITCPSAADGNYLMVLNDGAVRFSRTGKNGGFTLGGFDLAFLSPVPVSGGDYGRLRLSGTLFDGSMAYTDVSFPGQDGFGNFMFGSAAIGADFLKQTFRSLTIDACVFDADSNCVNSFDNPANNQAQFALDNLRFDEVPEPGSFLLAGLAIGALALQRRRAARKGA